MKNDQDSRERTSYSYRFGSAEFNEAKFELRVAGLPVEVERRALDVLAYLLRHAGEVVTKEELLREVWAGRITVDKVLPNAVTKLRRALGEANAERLLTQARVGYRLDGVVGRVAVGRRLSSHLELVTGQAVPARPNFILQRQLGSNRGSEVWLAEHAKTHERRVYKFAADDARLRALKREATLCRVLQESLPERAHFVDILDWNFEHPPFFLECEYGGENLLEWAKAGLAVTSDDERIALFLQMTDAVAAAHRVGVLHKDLKPANVLIAADNHGRPLLRLTDFGSGSLLDPDRLDELGITQFGLSATQGLGADSTTGTPLYVAPEVFSGQAPTVQSDVFALGIILYQLLCGDLGKPMASGWEQDIADPTLREDIRLATDGNPARRLASAAEFAARLRSRDERREQARQVLAAEEHARSVRQAFARSRARRPYLIALVAALAAGVVIALTLYQTALRARNDARRELDRATAINQFLNEDLISQSNPLVAAKGGNASLKDVLLASRGRVTERFPDQPSTAASIHGRLGKLLDTIEQMPEAEAEYRLALSLYEKTEGPSAPNSLKARTDLANLLSRTSKLDAALEQIKQLQQLTAHSDDAYTKYLVASAQSLYYINLGNYEKALPELQAAINLLKLSDPANTAELDALRFNLIPVYLYTDHGDQATQEADALIGELKARPDRNALKIALASMLSAGPYIDEGKYDKAESILLEAQKTIVAILGEDHSKNVLVLNDLLSIAHRRKDWPKALAYAQKMYEIFSGKFGSDHIKANVALTNWGMVLYSSGNFAEAEIKLETAYRKITASVSAQNPQAQNTAFWLAATDIELGKVDQAEVLLASLDLKTLESGGGGGWDLRLDVLRGLMLVKRGDNLAAKPLLQSAVDAMERDDTTDNIMYSKAKRALSMNVADTEIHSARK
jgi:non-specific serine/threonine protein kinase